MTSVELTVQSMVIMALSPGACWAGEPTSCPAAQELQPWDLPLKGLCCTLGKQLVCAECSVCRQKITLSVGRAQPSLKPVKTLSFPLHCRGYADVVTPEVAGESKSTQSLS